MKAKISTFLNFAKIGSLVIAMALFLLSSGVSAGNISLANPGFEDGLNGWENWMSANNFVETTAANLHSGSKSIALKPMAWSGAGFGQTFTTGFKAGETFTLSAYAKVFGNIGTEQANIFIQFVDGNGKKDTRGSANYSKTDKLELQSISAIVPEGTISIVVGVWFGGPDNTVLYIDDFNFSLGLGGLSIVNPGIENDLTGWENWMPDNNVIETNAKNVNSGLKSIALKPVNWSGAGFGQSFVDGFSAGQSYTLSASSKISGTVGDNQADIFIQFVDASNKKTTFSSPKFTKTDAFEIQSVTAVIPAGTVKVVVGVWFGGPDGTIMYIDDFNLVQNAVVPEMLKNSGFESGLANWDNWTPANNIIETTTDNIRAGKQSIALKPVAWSGAGFGQSIYTGFKIGESYTLSAYGKISGDIQGKQANISIQFKDAAGLGKSFDSPNFSKTNGFEIQNISAIVPEGTVEIAVSVWFNGPDKTILYVDDFKLAKTVVVEGLVKNASFESGLEKWGNWMPANNIIETNLANVNSGKQSIALKPVSSSGAGFGQGIDLSIAAGETYTLSAFGKVFGNIGTEQANISIQFIDDKNVKTLVNATNFSKTDKFEKKSVTAIVPAGAVGMSVLVWFNGPDNTILYVDDFELVKGGGTTSAKTIDLTSSEFKVFPNPLCGDVLNICTKGMTGNKSMSIFDMTSKMVFSKNLQDTDNHVVNLSDLNLKGMYIVRVSSKNSIRSQKLIIY